MNGKRSVLTILLLNNGIFISRPVLVAILRYFKSFSRQTFYLMARLSILKLEHPQRLQVSYQYYGQLMTENFFFIFFFLKNLVNSALSQNWLQMCVRSAMKIYANYSCGGTILW